MLNHENAIGTHPWYESIKFPGSVQVGYLASFIRKLAWWRLKPAQEILVYQPGDSTFNHFISVARTDNNDLIIAYLPFKSTIRLYNPMANRYQGEWFNPTMNEYTKAKITSEKGLISSTYTEDSDMILVLRKL